MEEEGEEEAQRNYCRRMISHLKKQHPDSSEKRETGKRRKEPREERLKRQTTLSGRQAGVQIGHGTADHSVCILPVPEPATREGALTSPSLPVQGPPVQLVPPQLISLLRHKTFKEEMKRAVEVELHDPAVCSMCEQKQASVALSTFIRRKKTQLDVQTLEERLNTKLMLQRQFEPIGGVCAQPSKVLQCPSQDLGGITRERYAGHSNLELP
ncbi:uncharacterized protein LOC115366745 [Myripristis murdjan]|uniref:uncharacterized protein LOC115366745 n=1 Tax=Myripristis murdjan TaxID=586833 RepID=UPI0011760784|nr:uncharacterized protein LOC115366745 [Myripristis murdjan]